MDKTEKASSDRAVVVADDGDPSQSKKMERKTGTVE